MSRPAVTRLTLTGAAVIAPIATAAALLLGPTSSASAQPGAASGYLCARSQGSLLPVTAISGSMRVTFRISEAHPVSTGIVTSPGRSPMVARYQWFSDVNAALPGLPRNFGPFDESASVNAGPARIFQVIETIQSFPNGADAAAFLRMFERPAALAEVIVNGKIRRVGFEMRKISGLGSQALATTSQAHSGGFPVDVQYVVRTGSVVTTLQLVGGREITASRELALARRAQAHLLGTCPALGRRG